MVLYDLTAIYHYETTNFLARFGTYLTAIYHYVGIMRYVTGAVSICLSFGAISLMLYEWLKLAITFEFFQTFIGKFHDTLVNVGIFFYVFNTAGNEGNLFFWIGAGTYRDAGDIEMTNLFVGLAFLWIGLGALLIVLIGYVLTKFRNLVFESSTGHENLVKVVKKITFQMGLFGMIGINTILGG